MKRGVVLLALIGLLTMGMTGCILSTNPPAGTTIAVPMGKSQTFTVRAFLNKTFTWYKGDQVISGATAASYTFTPEAADADKLITIKVVAIDLLNQTETKEWKAAVTNPPTADAGEDLSIVFGMTAQLDGSGSADPEGSPLTYQWTVTSRPDGSTAEITGDTHVNPTFKPDIPGVYVISLVVNDGMVDSEADTIEINAYIDGTFESGIADPWSVPVATNASYALSSSHVHGGSKAFHPTCALGHDNDNQVVLRLSFPKSTYIYSISAWVYRVGTDPLTSAIHSELYVDDKLMLNGSPAPHEPHYDGMYHILDPDVSNTWVQRTWAINAKASKIDFKYNDLWIIDNIYLDDIEINTWGD